MLRMAAVRPLRRLSDIPLQVAPASVSTHLLVDIEVASVS